jgi:hypothetical protein
MIHLLKKRKMKKIKFSTTIPNIEIPVPQPAYKMIPEWFRKLPGVVKGIETIKKCVPVLDTMTSGYMIVLAADVYFDGTGLQQVSKTEVVTTHDKLQLGEFVPPEKEYNPQPFKWINFFHTKTPKGYSTIFTHPLNRIDLPFYSLTGVVDTDKHPVPVNFPFFVKKDFVGVIPAGTPIIQAIPFKRNNWEHSVEENIPRKIPMWWYSHTNPPFNLYKRMSWSKKTYK